MATTQTAPQEIPATLPAYYRDEFQKIRESGGKYEGKWNFVACLAGPFWALAKGLQAIVVVWVLAAIFTFGLSILFYAYVLGKRGNFMYYTKVMTGRNLIV
jgi:hypothetical protein